MHNLPADFIGKYFEYAKAIGTINPWAIGIGLCSVVMLIYWQKVTQKVPGSLVVLVLMTVLVKLFNLPVETIGSRFGTVPAHLPHPALPFSHLDFTTIKALFPSAMTIALLCGIESLLSAVVADGMTSRRHNSNMELIAQGCANIITPFFGGIPATGAIARTATNIKNGGTTPVAGIVHALTLAACLVILGSLVTMIPLAALAAILILVSYTMSEIKTFIKLFSGPRSDIMALLATFSLTVLMDLTVAIGVGVVLAAILFMARMANTSNIVQVGKSLEEEDECAAEADDDGLGKLQTPYIAGVVRYQITGAFFFGMADKFKDVLSQISSQAPKVIIIDIQSVTSMDATALIVLRNMYEKCVVDKTALIIQGVHNQPIKAMRRAGYIKMFGIDNLVKDEASATKRAMEIIGVPVN